MDRFRSMEPSPHPVSQPARALQPAVQRAAENMLQQAVAERVTPGATYGVLYRGRIAALGSVGRFTYEPDSSPVLSDTPYDLASLTKVAATTATIMQLWQQQRVRLDTLLADLLPGFVIGAPDAAARRRITLRMLLAHASGLPASIPLYERCSSRVQLLRELLHLPLEAEPGERTAYSDPGFMLLGAALEALTGARLDALARELVFSPSGMRATGFRPAPSLQRLIPPTENDTAFRHRVVQGEVHDENGWMLGGVSGHAGLFAPAEDMLRLAEAMLAPLRPAAAETLFSAETVRLFTTRANLPPGSSRALGWDTPSGESSSGKLFSPSSFGHLGFTGTSLWIDPEADAAVVLLTNRTYPTRENKAIQGLRPGFHDAVREALTAGTSGSAEAILPMPTVDAEAYNP